VAALPQLYNSTDLPPAPPGLEWERYADGVPELPPAPPGFAWRYSTEQPAPDYYFTDIDKESGGRPAQNPPPLCSRACIRARWPFPSAPIPAPMSTLSLLLTFTFLLTFFFVFCRRCRPP
jgi:hypothetical protein